MQLALEYPAPDYSPVSLMIVRANLVPIALEVGTGGEQTVDYYRQRGAMGYPLARYDSARKITASSNRTPVDDLSRIRTVLKPAVADLAHALGVSRQAIYDWQNGKPIGSANASRLAALARAGDVFAAEGLTSPSQLLRRPIKGGKSFLDLVRDGESPEDTIRELVSRVRRELEQQQMLAARLANRKKPKIAWDDYGSPMLDEMG
jgi:transcriptional regulator with XRE-family HTH domain